jgi:uncharacterized protein (TIGR02284 family)
MSEQQAIRALGYLARIVEAGEKGYAVSAANADNPGLKILFKTFAQQRAKFNHQILAEIQDLGGVAKPRSSIRGIIHRGRIDIFSALTIEKAERERVVLKEVLLGEKAALHAYEKTLRADLPPETREMISKQYGQVQELVEKIRLIQGLKEERMIVRLFDAKGDLELALKALKDSSLQLIRIEKIDVHDSLELYEGRGGAVHETTISGAVGGVLWGSLFGGLAGIVTQQTVILVPFAAAPVQSAWPFISLLVGIVAGALFGAILGFAIGIGISEEDTYAYNQGMKQGKILLLSVVENSQASEVQRIFSQIHPPMLQGEEVAG